MENMLVIENRYIVIDPRLLDIVILILSRSPLS